MSKAENDNPQILSEGSGFAHKTFLKYACNLCEVWPSNTIKGTVIAAMQLLSRVLPLQKH